MTKYEWEVALKRGYPDGYPFAIDFERLNAYLMDTAETIFFEWILQKQMTTFGAFRIPVAELAEICHTKREDVCRMISRFEAIGILSHKVTTTQNGRRKAFYRVNFREIGNRLREFVFKDTAFFQVLKAEIQRLSEILDED